MKLLSASADICDRAIERGFASACEGMTETEMAREIDMAFTQAGARHYFITISFGKKSANMPYPSDNTLKQGDLIRFDGGCIYENYYSDLARCAVLGEPTEKQERYYNAVLAGEKAAYSLIRPGAEVRSMFKAAVEEIRKQGIPHYNRHHVGHGVGQEAYEPPLVSPVDFKLEEGMVLNIETPYYELGFGGVQVEDTFLVTEDGYENLSSGERELAVHES